MQYADNVPAYLRKPELVQDIEKYTAGIGSSRGPHITPKNVKWLAVDSAGAQTVIGGFDPQTGVFVDVVVIDANPGKARTYYDEEWSEGSNTAPVCFSNDGKYPDAEAAVPQARSCAECQWSRWGSDISKASGKEIKACAERKRLAVLSLHNFNGPVFEFSVSPSNLKTWNAYMKETLGRGYPPNALITRISFGPTQGSLAFANATAPNGTGIWWVPEAAVERVLLAASSEECKQAIGFYANPAVPMLNAPVQQQQIEHQPVGESAALAAHQATAQRIHPSEPSTSQPAGIVNGVSPDAGAETAARRPRRTKAEMREARAAGNPPVANGSTGQPSPANGAGASDLFSGVQSVGHGVVQGATAGSGTNGQQVQSADPFDQPPAAQTAGPSAADPFASPGAGSATIASPSNFGIAQATPASADLDAMLDNVFKS